MYHYTSDKELKMTKKFFNENECPELGEHMLQRRKQNISEENCLSATIAYHLMRKNKLDDKYTPKIWEAVKNTDKESLRNIANSVGTEYKTDEDMSFLLLQAIYYAFFDRISQVATDKSMDHKFWAPVWSCSGHVINDAWEGIYGWRA